MMSDDSMTRWTVTVSKETDIAVRSFLAQRGLKKGGLSRFIEEAARWRVLDQTVSEVRAQFADLPAEALQDIIDEATQDIRAAMRDKLADATRKAT
jgi:Ribbon-helix-helix domain